MANRIITISGKQFSGKDVVAKMLISHFTSFRRLALGDAIKLEYSKRKGLDLSEIEKNKHIYRPDLIALGDWGRSIDPDYWIKSVVNTPGDLVVPDLRMPREYEVFRASNSFSIRVEASIEARSKRGIIVNSDDITETALDSSNWDYMIFNNGTYEELSKIVDDLCPLIKTRLNIGQA